MLLQSCKVSRMAIECFVEIMSSFQIRTSTRMQFRNNVYFINPTNLTNNVWEKVYDVWFSHLNSQDNVVLTNLYDLSTHYKVLQNKRTETTAYNITIYHRRFNVLIYSYSHYHYSE